MFLLAVKAGGDAVLLDAETARRRRSAVLAHVSCWRRRRSGRRVEGVLLDHRGLYTCLTVAVVHTHVCNNRRMIETEPQERMMNA